MHRYFNLPEEILNMHVHGRDMDQSHKATVLNVLQEAKQGLNNIVGFMPNTKPPITSIKVLDDYSELIKNAEKKLKLSRRQYIWFGITDYNLDDCQQALQKNNVIGLKLYPRLPRQTSVTTGYIGVFSNLTILKAMKLTREYNKVFAAHCDNPYIINKEGYTIRAEKEYVEKILSLAREAPAAKLLICHVSSKASAEIILEAQKNGINVAIELCPQYLWFDNQKTNWNLEDPNFYKCYNNLRSSNDRIFLIDLLTRNNNLIIIASDHAPHTKREKLRGVGGIPCLMEMVPVIVTLAVKYHISEKRVADLLSFNGSKFFNIPVSDNLIQYRLKKKKDDLQYHGDVLNPWNGSELYFPVL